MEVQKIKSQFVFSYKQFHIIKEVYNDDTYILHHFIRLMEVNGVDFLIV